MIITFKDEDLTENSISCGFQIKNIHLIEKLLHELHFLAESGIGDVTKLSSDKL